MFVYLFFLKIQSEFRWFLNAHFVLLCPDFKFKLKKCERKPILLSFLDKSLTLHHLSHAQNFLLKFYVFIVDVITAWLSST